MPVRLYSAAIKQEVVVLPFVPVIPTRFSFDEGSRKKSWKFPPEIAAHPETVSIQCAVRIPQSVPMQRPRRPIDRLSDKAARRRFSLP